MDPHGRSEALQAGQSVGKFYLVRLIGQGGTSRIFKALQQPINRIVALKIPSFAGSGNILTPDEFLSEATLMARLEHPHVVRIYDFGVHEDSAFICMEYVEGWNLAEWIEANGPMSAAAVLAAGIQTLDALLHAHSHDVLHLDLSPANVLISRQGSLKLSDFGMAGKRMRTGEGRIVGTPAFLSPEHVAGGSGTPASDLFAFGSLLYYAASGEPLFDPGPGNIRVTQAIGEIETARARPPEDRLRRVTPQLSGIIRMSLQGADGGEILAALRSAFRAACGDDAPEATLRRELGLDGSAPGSLPEEAIPEGEALRGKYLGLREEGKHREAVALLERAMRRHPENPVLRELLAQPPARQKSGSATMEVGPGRADARASGMRKKGNLALAAAGTLAVTLAFLAWTRSGSPREPSAPNRAPESLESLGDAPAGATSAPASPSRTPTAVLPRQAGPDVAGAGSRGPVSEPAKAIGSPATGGPASAKAAGMAAVPDGHPRRAGTLSHPGEKTGSTRRPRPPAVAIAGPAGTRVSVDDTAEWISPGPKGGWPVAPGLVNITLTPPGHGRPISSSLFVSEDTLYLLSLDAEGGFSIARRRR
jgi:serine/threonine protein kinase